MSRHEFAPNRAWWSPSWCFRDGVLDKIAAMPQPTPQQDATPSAVSTYVENPNSQIDHTHVNSLGMKFTPATLDGAYLVDPAPLPDERGFFARTFCLEEFAAHSIPMSLNQASVSYNERRGTLRGLHYQVAPHEEHKLVRCTAGSIFDVIVDLRPESPQYRQWFGVELSAANHRALYVPPGMAHGFLTLADASEVYYMISTPYSPAVPSWRATFPRC